MISTSADRLVTVRRRTAYVLDAVTAAASLTLSRQPARTSILRVEVAGGTTGSGTVTVTGTVDGVAGTQEVLTFTANGTKQSARRFSAISAIVTTGLADEAAVATVSIQAVGLDGSPQPTDYALATSRPAILQPGDGSWPSPTQGSNSTESARWLIDFEEAWTPRRGDIVREDASGDDWLVQGVEQVRGRFAPVLWRLRCTRVQV